MGRHGYVDDCDQTWDWVRWRGAVASAIRGKRGQAFLKELLDSLDAMPVKRLIAKDLVTTEGEVCAIGSVVVNRGLNVAELPVSCYETIAEKLGINSKLVQEIEYINDETNYYVENNEYFKMTPEKRFEHVREWVIENLRSQQAS